MIPEGMMIDADTHIDESEDTWAYWPESEVDWKPSILEFSEKNSAAWLTVAGSGSRHTREWFVDGQIYPRRYRDDERTGTTLGTRELTDIPRRIADMDALNIGVHVLYPTVLLTELTLRPHLMTWICQSYNRWLAERCEESGGRLRWVAQIPFLAGETALAEVRWAKDHGAVGIFKRGIECGGLPANDRLFWPVYALASDLDLPICIHAASAWRYYAPTLTLEPTVNGFEGLQAFRALLDGDIYGRFPDLRIGIVEFGSAWLPFIFGFIRSNKSLDELNCFVTCEPSEDLAYVTAKAGINNLVLGSDYTHADRASVRDAHNQILKSDELSDEAKLKITNTNARRMYSLS